MRTFPGKLLLMLIVAVAFIFVAWGAAQAAPQGMMSSQKGMSMQMMKKMMMNPPQDSKEAQHYIKDQKQKAMSEGKYNCCLHHSCDWCAVHMGECPCYSHAAHNKPVCNECKGGWAAGDGRVPGKTAKEIKTMPRPAGGSM